MDSAFHFLDRCTLQLTVKGQQKEVMLQVQSALFRLKANVNDISLQNILLLKANLIVWRKVFYASQ